MKLISRYIVFLFIFLHSSCSTSSVPEKVQQAFMKKFPTVTPTDWEKESDTEWEAAFKIKDVSYSANFLEDGTWIETEYEISIKEVPDSIKKIVMKAFPDHELDEAEMLETVEGRFYEFEIEKGLTEMEIVMDMNGTILKKEMQQEEDDRD